MGGRSKVSIHLDSEALVLTLYLVNLRKCFIGVGIAKRMSNDSLDDEQLCKRLDDLKYRNFKLGDMYRGAIQALESSSPDRCAQAANSLRELLEKLVCVATGTERQRGGGIFKSKRKKLQELRSQYDEKPDILKEFFKQFDRYIELNDKMTMKDLMIKAMSGVYGVDTDTQNVDQVIKLLKKIQNITHHQVSCGQDEVGRELGKIIKELKVPLSIIIDNLAVTEQREIKEILEGNE